MLMTTRCAVRKSIPRAASSIATDSSTATAPPRSTPALAAPVQRRCRNDTNSARLERPLLCRRKSGLDPRDPAPPRPTRAYFTTDQPGGTEEALHMAAKAVARWVKTHRALTLGGGGLAV